jgi:hypothetical protein
MPGCKSRAEEANTRVCVAMLLVALLYFSMQLGIRQRQAAIEVELMKTEQATRKLVSAIARTTR